MTGPGSPSPTPPPLIDGKYQVLRELSRQGQVTLYEVSAAAGVHRRVSWYEVGTPSDRQDFHTYRAALRSVAPAGLTDVVARPGAYYAVWQTVEGVPLADALAQPVRRQELVDQLETLANRLGRHGFALSDAQILVQGDQPVVADLPLRPPRSAEEIAALNAPLLAQLHGGKRRPRREKRPGAWLTFVPGLLFLGGAAWFGSEAVRIFLNPPVADVANVQNKDARSATKALIGSGFQVEYTYSESGGVPIGTVLRQEPAPGTSLPLGRTVSLAINRPQPLVVPKLEDMTVPQAKDALKDYALSIGKVVKVDGTVSKTPEGRIVAQIPAAGASTQRGQPIQVMVSTGVRAEQTWIPDLRGMTFDEAREYARAAGLVVTTVTKEASDRLENTVLSQEPAAFEPVTVGSPVKLVVAGLKYSPPAEATGSLPIPPPYVPPPPPTPVTPPVQAPAQQAPTQQAPVQQTPTPIPAQPPAQEQPAQNSQGNTGGLPTRTVSLNYAFPGDLPAGTYTIAVQDASGERLINFTAQAEQVAGRLAQASVQVTGDAIFIVRRDGQEYARVLPREP